jgi:uncharacterized damage-inducible protein DinB
MSLGNDLKYHRWAVERTLQAAEALSAEEFSRDLGGSFKSVRDTLQHWLIADNTWAHRVRGEVFTRPALEDGPDTLIDLRQAWEPVLNGWDELLRIRDATETIAYHAFDGAPHKSSLEDIVRQVVNHGSYHRGQVALMLRQLGHAPQNTDWIAFTRLER